jgi:cyclopropane fatty-acyl-phospholipid synthase-like methyltransferase
MTNFFFEEYLKLKPGYQKLAELIYEWAQSKSVCDFGCGNGFLLYFLAGRGIEVSGVEGSNDALKFMDNSIRPRILIRDLTEPIEAGIHDLVISAEVAEHLPKRASATFVQNLANSAARSLYSHSPGPIRGICATNSAKALHLCATLRNPLLAIPNLVTFVHF